MKRVILWNAFVGGVLCVALLFGVKAVRATLAYSRLNATAMAAIASVEIAGSDNSYHILAHYAYTVAGQTLHGTSRLGKSYPNKWAAEERLAKITLPREQTLWYSPKKPGIAAFERPFPWKETLSALIVLGIALYFFSLGYYTTLKKGR